MSDQESKDVPMVPNALTEPSVIGTPESRPERVSQAIAKVTEIGKSIALEFPDLQRRDRLRLLRGFRAQLIPPGKPGRKRRKEITAAHADWKGGLRGLPLYRKHIPGFDRMNWWKRKAKMGALRDAIRSRERRSRKSLAGGTPCT